MRIRMLLLLSTSLILTSCTKNARLYNLQTGAVTQIKFSYSGTGRGKILPFYIAEEQFAGEYTTVASGTTAYTSVYIPPERSADGRAHVQGATTSAVDSEQKGQAIATGDKGT